MGETHAGPFRHRPDMFSLKSRSLSRACLHVMPNRMNHVPQRAEVAYHGRVPQGFNSRLMQRSIVASATPRLTGLPDYPNPPFSTFCSSYLRASSPHLGIWRPCRPWRPKSLAGSDTAAERSCLCARQLYAQHKRLTTRWRWTSGRRCEPNQRQLSAHSRGVLGVLASLAALENVPRGK